MHDLTVGPVRRHLLTMAAPIAAGLLMQAIFLPAMALAFAVAPVAGQNFGAQLHDVWQLSVTSVALQAVLSLWLVRTVMRQKLHRPAHAGSGG